jgi:lipoprotein-releasing system permease protein
MVVALAVVTGFKEAVKEKLYHFNGHVHVSYYSPIVSNSYAAPPIYNDAVLHTALQRVPHVLRVSPFVQRPVILQAGGKMEGISLKGVDKNYTLPASISFSGKPITYPDSGYSRNVILSEKTAELLDIQTGDTIQLQYIDESARPRIRRVNVSGLYASGMADVDKYFALCDIRLLQRLNNWTGDSINAFQIDLDYSDYADSVSNYIHYNLINAPLESFTTNENYPNIIDWLHFQDLNSMILLVIMGIVAIINMAAVLLMLMVDRAAMIGLLKALGMGFRQTVQVFIYIGVLIGGAGILLGNLLAIALCLLQQHFRIIKLPEESYYMKYAPVKLIWWHVVATDAVALLLFVVCMWLPALYIRTIQPAKVLQFR